MTLRMLAIPALLMAAMAGTAEAGVQLISNGTFETGNLSGWTTFTTAVGTTGTPAVVDFDTNNDLVATRSARFQVGRVTAGSSFEGGGIYQSITTVAGALTLSADIASAFYTTNTNINENLSGGLIELLLDNVVVASHNFGSIIRNTTEFSLLSYVTNVTAGTHEVRIRMTRPYTTLSDTPFQYLDNVSAMQESVPEPTSIAMWSLTALGFIYLRRKRRQMELAGC